MGKKDKTKPWFCHHRCGRGWYGLTDGERRSLGRHRLRCGQRTATHLCTTDEARWCTRVPSVAAYTTFRAVETRRVERQARLAQAAVVAVRRTEAGFVRPLLRDRMAEAVASYLARRAGEPPLHLRLQLFSELQRAVALTDEEKRVAHTVAVNHLVTLLRSMPSAPLRAPLVESTQRKTKSNRLDHTSARPPQPLSASPPRGHRRQSAQALRPPGRAHRERLLTAQSTG